ALGGYYYYATLDERLHASFARAENMVLGGDYEGAIAAYLEIYDNHPDFALAPRALFRAGEVQNLFL
ncbi:MAG: hypothetical protein GWN87_19320, partial [Desulfuromonadales bacterium]|nr:hypothetical protein [Desulfuromonadales bacterium]